MKIWMGDTQGDVRARSPALPLTFRIHPCQKKARGMEVEGEVEGEVVAEVVVEVVAEVEG